MRKLKNFLAEFGFEPDFNNAILFRLKSNNLLLKMVFGIARLFGRIPFNMFKNSFYPEANSRIVEIPFVLQHIPQDKSKKIMDFGCSESVLPLQLASLGYQITGFDLQNYGYKHPNFHFIRGDFLKNKMHNSSFDIAIAISSIEHAGLGSYKSPVFSDGDIKIVDEIKRKLKKGGRLLITVPFGKKFKDKLTRIYDSQTLRDLLKGFKMIKEEYYIRNKEKTTWIKQKKELVEKTGYNGKPGYHGNTTSDGVACLVCEK